MRSLLLCGAFLFIFSGTAMAQPDEWISDIGPGLNQYDDDCDQVALGFDFDFFGTTWSSVWVNSNGNLTFDGCHSAWDWTQFDVNNPSYYASDAIAAPLYLDFNPWSGGDVHANTVGAPGEQIFVATWYFVPEYPSTGSNVFQAQLHEATGAVVFSYNGMDTDGLSWYASNPGVVGLSQDSAVGPWDYMGSEIPALDGSTLCYTPDGWDNYVLSTDGCDSDGDGVPNSEDVCADTVLPEDVPTIALGTNRWADVDGDGVFDTTLPNGNGPGLSFTIEDTAGCSCEQIIDALSLGKGHTKFGCSISAMEDWISGL